jgi:hypothetical protein
MVTSYGLLLLGAGVVAYGLADNRLEVFAAGIAIVIIAAFLCRMRGAFRFQWGRIKIEGELIGPETDATRERTDDEGDRSAADQQ